jgi:peptidoglycan/LPS O-acetylase OafA/YrhL
MSYAIYVLHFPVICVLPEFGPPSFFYVEVVGKVLLVLLLAYVAEEVWQKHVNRWMDRHILGKKNAKLTPSH